MSDDERVEKFWSDPDELGVTQDVLFGCTCPPEHKAGAKARIFLPDQEAGAKAKKPQRRLPRTILLIR